MVSPSNFLIDHFRNRPSQHCLVSAVDCHDCIVRLWNVSYRLCISAGSGLPFMHDDVVYSHSSGTLAENKKPCNTILYQRH